MLITCSLCLATSDLLNGCIFYVYVALWQNFDMLSHHCLSSIQTLKNALSLYKLGGAAGGSDFDPKGKSDNEVCTVF
jgi:glutamate dehydrogenase/leucine dehydrogenase